MKKTVTIGIAAHNEEKNIAFLLKDILRQKRDNFKLESVVVVCDGCTDNTAEEIKKVAKAHTVIRLKNDGKRKGKAKRMNDIYKNVTSNIFISLDADIHLQNTSVISHVVRLFKNEKVGLVGGRISILPQRTFIGKILEAQEYFWTVVVNSINMGNNLQSHTGPISAVSKSFLQTVKRPEYIIADDHFLYFSAIQSGFLYKAAKNLGVFINVPTTFSDYMKQSTRFIDSAEQLKTYFGEWVDPYYTISYTKKLRAYLIAFKKFHLYMVFALGLVSLQKALSMLYKEKSTKGIWTTVKSTK